MVVVVVDTPFLDIVRAALPLLGYSSADAVKAKGGWSASWWRWGSRKVVVVVVVEVVMLEMVVVVVVEDISFPGHHADRPAPPRATPALTPSRLKVGGLSAWWWWWCLGDGVVGGGRHPLS